VRRSARRCPLLLCAILAVVGCAAPQQNTLSSASGNVPAPSVSRSIVAGVKTPLPFLYRQLNPTNTSAGGGPEVVDLVSSGLTVVNNRGERVPQLGEQVPTLENGLWKLLPDGAMELTWQIHPGARWHDGVPLTAHDLAFTVQVNQDVAYPVLRNRIYEIIESAAAADERTLLTRWSRPYIYADALFSATLAAPLPNHVLDTAYAEDKASFLDHPYFNQQYVGTGPFKLRSWDIGSGLMLEAFPDYVLGRPRIDVIEIRYLIDDNALIAGVLAGAVDLVLGAPISVEQALQVRSQWQGGRAEFLALRSLLKIYPQFVDPAEPLILNPQFRRALLHAIDRQEMADSIQFGVVPVAESFVSPRSPHYAALDPSIVRHPYDLRRSVTLIEGLGYRRGADGAFVDAAGRKLSVAMQVTRAQEIQIKTAFAVEDYWRQIGVGTEVDVVPVQLAQDAQYRANFPGFSVQRQPGDEEAIPKLHSSEARLASRGYRGSNNARYVDPDMDLLVERFQSTVPLRERIQTIGQIVRRVTDEVIWMTTVFDSEPALISNRLVNVGAKENGAAQTWNAHEWSTK
jgi:peptide/nickel transport system substrate-binding protein